MFRASDNEMYVAKTEAPNDGASQGETPKSWGYPNIVRVMDEHDLVTTESHGKPWVGATVHVKSF